MKLEAVLFDLDGTLADTLSDLAASGNWCLERLGLPAQSVADYRWHVGSGLQVMAERTTAAAGAPPESGAARDFAALFREHYAGHHLDSTLPYDGVLAMLSALAEQGLQLAVLSNKPMEFTREMVAALFPAGLFAAVWGQQDRYPRKPDPASALALVAELGVAPEACAFVGDTSVDMDTATAAGMLPVGVLWGFRTREELLSHGARHLANSPEEVTRVLRLHAFPDPI